MLNSGTLRSDALHPAGDFTRGHLTAVLPFVDPIVVLRASADDILQSLENSVSKWPSHEGRFAQVGVRGLDEVFVSDCITSYMISKPKNCIFLQ